MRRDRVYVSSRPVLAYDFGSLKQHRRHVDKFVFNKNSTSQYPAANAFQTDHFRFSLSPFTLPALHVICNLSQLLLKTAASQKRKSQPPPAIPPSMDGTIAQHHRHLSRPLTRMEVLHFLPTRLMRLGRHELSTHCLAISPPKD